MEEKLIPKVFSSILNDGDIWEKQLNMTPHQESWDYSTFQEKWKDIHYIKLWMDSQIFIYWLAFQFWRRIAVS